jgi:putative pyruvate formate lyase activating enzyme
MVIRFIRPDSLSVWKDPEILRRFSSYRGILDNTRIARYLIAKSCECEFDPKDSIENLETLLKEKSLELKELLQLDTSVLKTREVKENSYINLVEILSRRYLENCIFCERKCKVNRIQNKMGYCLIGKDSYVSSAFLHHGEESVLVPSGTIFFQGCNFGCVFCQNSDISQSWK